MMGTTGKEAPMTTHRTGRRLVAAFAASSVVVLTGTVLAQEKPAGCIQADAPKKVEGQVVQIDPDQGKVTVRESNGTTHDFHASPETLRGYKVGDRIQAALRPGQECQKPTS
jgi:Cu/Ag efflux protein CusF